MKTVSVVLCIAICCAAAFGRPDDGHIECGTPDALAAFWAGRPLQRPDFLPETLGSDRFLVHYATSGQHAVNPAYAESVLVYAEHSWRIQVDSLGWAPPPPDGTPNGDDRYDIYIREMSYSGLTTPEARYSIPYPDGYTSFMEIKRNQTPWSKLRAVVAHEFNHASQYRYRRAEQGDEWWLENTANWMSNVCYEDAKLYLSSLNDDYNPLTQPELSINHTGTTRADTNYWYAGAIWPMFLHEYYGIACPRRCWERFGANPEAVMPSIDWVLSNTYRSTLAEALKNYAVWRYFTGPRADTAHYFRESHLWPESHVLHTHDGYPASGDQGNRAPSGPGGTNFLQFRSGTEDLLEVTFDGQNGFDWAATAVGCRMPRQSMERDILLDANQQGTAEMPWPGNAHIALIPVVTQWDPPAPDLTHTYQAKETRSSEVDTAWVRRYNGPGHGDHWAYALAVDAQGNAYVTGESWGGSGTARDYATIKYSPAGDELWVGRYNGPGNDADVARALALDAQGNVYVTGYSVAVSDDYATVKYSPAGSEIWVRRYDGPEGWWDKAAALAVDAQGNVYVTGRSYGGVGTLNDYATIKYSPTGSQLWVRRYNGPRYGPDWAVALAVDAQGDVYVTGCSEGMGTYVDYATIKYSPAGGELWVRRYNGPANSSDYAKALAVDSHGNVYVTGNSWGSDSGTDHDYDYATIKYSPAGDELWVRRYNGPGDSTDMPFALAVDADDNVYVTGMSLGSGTGSDYATIKYSPNGEELWVRRYNGPGNGEDKATALAVDAQGNVYVTGSSEGMGTDADFATIKYSPAGEELWVRRYNGPGNGEDNASALAVDWQGNVYVTGRNWGPGTNYEYATIKYVQSPRQPHIWTSLRYVSLALRQYRQQDIVLRLFNNGDADLQWSVAKDPPVSWLAVTPTSGTTPPRPNNRTDLTLSFNATGLDTGFYHTNLVFTSNDPDRPEKPVSVELYVRPSHARILPPVAVDSLGTGFAETPAGEALPTVFALESGYPSLFVSQTAISYALPQGSPLELRVYSPAGALVRTLRSGFEQAGYHRAIWDGRDDAGNPVGRGVYYYRLTAGEHAATRKVVKTE